MKKSNSGEIIKKIIKKIIIHILAIILETLEVLLNSLLIGFSIWLIWPLIISGVFLSETFIVKNIEFSTSFFIAFAIVIIKESTNYIGIFKKK